MKRVLAILCLVVILFTGVNALSDSDENGYLEIHNCTELQQMNESLSSNYELMNDINCSGFDPGVSGHGFVPIGNLTDPFSGVLDGNTYTIYNFYVNRTTGNAALFSNTGTMGLRDVNFVNMSITANEGYAGIVGVASDSYMDYVVAEGLVVSHIYGAGGLVAKSTGIVAITYSSMSGSVYGEYNPTGGLVGEGSGTYDHVTNNANVILIYTDYCGGIVGKADVATLINFGTNNGNISIPVTYSNGVGGIMGTGEDVDIWSSLNTGVISGSYNSGGLYGGQQDCAGCSLDIGWSHNSGTIIVNGISVGGLVGWSGNVNIESSYNSGDMICGAAESSSVGGLIGDPGSVIITNSYNSGDINCSGSTLVGGLVANPYSDGSVSVINSFNIGKIYAINAGALVGKIGDSAVTISNSYWMNWSDVPINCYFNLSDMVQNPVECGVVSSDTDKYYFTGNLVNEPMAQFSSFASTGCSYPIETWESDDGLCRPDIHTYYNNSYGEIDWGFTPYIVNADYVNISNNYAFFNSTAFSQLNSSANVSFYNLPTMMINPQILKDGVVCSDCYNFTSLNAGNITFNVSSWSNYTIGYSELSASPVVYLFSVANSTSTSRTFTYNVSDDSEILNCSVYLNSELSSSNSSVVNKSSNNSIDISGLAVGSYNIYVSCTDEWSLVGNSSNVSFVVSAEIASGSSGGLNQNFFSISSSNLDNGFSGNLRRGQGFRFNISGQMHNLTLNSFSNLSANITVRSVPQNFLVNRNGSVLVDINSDGKKDIEVSYEKYSTSFALIKVRAVKIIANESVFNNSETENDFIPVPDKDDFLIWKIVVLVAFILIVVFVFYFINRYKKSKR